MNVRIMYTFWPNTFFTNITVAVVTKTNHFYSNIFSPMTLQPTLSLVLLCIEVSLSYTIIDMVGLLWRSDQSIAEASTYKGQHNI